MINSAHKKCKMVDSHQMIFTYFHDPCISAYTGTSSEAQMIPMNLTWILAVQVLASSILCLNFLMSSGVVLQQPPAIISDHTRLSLALWTMSNIVWSQAG